MHISAVDVHRSNTLSGGSLHNLISRALSGRTFSSPATRGIGRFAPSAPGYDPMAFQAIFPAQWAGRAKPRAERSDALGCNEMTTMQRGARNGADFSPGTPQSADGASQGIITASGVRAACHHTSAQSAGARYIASPFLTPNALRNAGMLDKGTRTR